jgi:hypothetical protein
LLSALQIEIWEGAEGERLVFHGEYHHGRESE